MKIFIEPDDVSDLVKLTFVGTPGDAKQPVDYIFCRLHIRRAAAAKMALALKEASQKTSKKNEVEI